MKPSFFVFAVLLLIMSCTTGKIVRWEVPDDVRYSLWTNNSKTVVFVPMIHVATSSHYASVRAVVDSLKHMNYVVFYEGVSNHGMQHSEEDVYLRKFRKMIGFSFQSTDYTYLLREQFSNAETYIADKLNQINSKLAIDQQDLRTDLTVKELVDAYEQLYGQIILTRKDRRIPLSNKRILPASLRLPILKVESVINATRNQYVAKTIQESNHQRIVLIYGMAHGRILEELKELDSKWNKVN